MTEQQSHINSYVKDTEQLLVDVDLAYAGMFWIPAFFVVVTPFLGAKSANYASSGHQSIPSYGNKLQHDLAL